MLMDIHRVEGIKYNFDRLTYDELSGIRGYLLESHQRITDEIGLIERTLFERQNDQLPMIGGTAVGAEVVNEGIGIQHR